MPTAMPGLKKRSCAVGIARALGVSRRVRLHQAFSDVQGQTHSLMEDADDTDSLAFKPVDDHMHPHQTGAVGFRPQVSPV